MFVRLTVNDGPETGKSIVFSRLRVAIGRGPENDLVLRDGAVSKKHGELEKTDNGYIYRDLKSRHGTLVRLGGISVNLQNHKRSQEIAINDNAQLTLGKSTVMVDIREGDRQPLAEEPPVWTGLDTASTPALQLFDERIISRTHDSLEAVTMRLQGQDPRLVSVFQLSRNLNTAGDLDEVLDQITKAAFEAFTAANFFAITLLPPDQTEVEIAEIQPLVSRARLEDHSNETNPLLSRSLLAQVAQSREAVLFVRDNVGTKDLSPSIVNCRITACLAAPLVGQRGIIGVMQTDTRGLGGLFSPDDLELFTAMASYAAFAIERVRLNNSILEMFEGIVTASVSAIDARDPFTAGHSQRVADITMKLAEAVNACTEGRFATFAFTPAELVELRYATLLHDIGKIGVRESVLMKAERLSPESITAVTERKDAVKAATLFQMLSRKLKELAKKSAPLDKTALQEMHSEAEESLKTLEDQFQLVLSASQKPRLEPEEIETIRQIGELSYRDVSGKERPYLTREEIENLTIRRGTLNSREWEDMKSHAVQSREQLRKIPWSRELRSIPEIAGGHHEKLDGSGYPDGISGERIPLQARIMAICDIYDALTAADRPYRKAFTHKKAFGVLKEEAERGLLDIELVDLFEKAVWPSLQENAE